MIESTDEQATVLKHGHPIRVSVPELGGDVVVVLAAQGECAEAVPKKHSTRSARKRSYRDRAGERRLPGWRRTPPDETR